MRGVLAIVVLTGCRGLLGLDEARLLDAAPPDDTADARQCYGSGLVSICLDKLPTQPRTLEGAMLDTATMCDQIVPAAPGGGEPCVIAGTSIEIASAITVRVVGPRPLVLVSTSTIEIAGTLSASSQRAGVIGAGALMACPFGATVGADDLAGAGGGGGGGFIGIGAKGGDGNLDGTPASGGAGGGAAPVTLHGGCPGARGGAGDAAASLGGAGGGAIYLIAAASIHVGGAITANGAGGEGGRAQDGGGAGGGAGGLVGFDAPVVMIPGVVTANGGGGGEGAGNATGLGGEDGAPTSNPARGGGSIAVNGGDGGDGAAGMQPAMPGNTGTGGGGGGGGGTGYIYAKSSVVAFTGTTSPAPTIDP